MTRSVVIADAGSLSALARIGQLDLLRGVFGAVLLTPVVAAEIGIDARGAASKAGGNAIRQSLAARCCSPCERRATSSAMPWWLRC